MGRDVTAVKLLVGKHERSRRRGGPIFPHDQDELSNQGLSYSKAAMQHDMPEGAVSGGFRTGREIVGDVNYSKLAIVRLVLQFQLFVIGRSTGGSVELLGTSHHNLFPGFMVGNATLYLGHSGKLADIPEHLFGDCLDVRGQVLTARLLRRVVKFLFPHRNGFSVDFLGLELQVSV